MDVPFTLAGELSTDKITERTESATISFIALPIHSKMTWFGLLDTCLMSIVSKTRKTVPFSPSVLTLPRSVSLTVPNIISRCHFRRLIFALNGTICRCVTTVVMSPPSSFKSSGDMMFSWKSLATRIPLSGSFSVGYLAAKRPIV